MGFWANVKRRLKAATVPFLLLSVAVFFGWNATQGNHGLVAYAQRQAMLAQVQSDNAAARGERDGWLRRIAGLQASHLDPDMLDERARAMLNYADPRDVVVLYPQTDKLF
jgi:cell division protein FtsB